MTHDHDMFVGIEFLVSTGRHVSHRNVLYAFEVGGIVFPWLTNVEQRESVAALLQRLDLIGRNFEVHNQKSITSDLQLVICRSVTCREKIRYAHGGRPGHWPMSQG